MSVWHSVVCEDVSPLHLHRTVRVMSCAAGYFFMDDQTGEYVRPQEFARREIQRLKDGETLIVDRGMLE